MRTARSTCGQVSVIRSGAGGEKICGGCHVGCGVPDFRGFENTDASDVKSAFEELQGVSFLCLR